MNILIADSGGTKTDWVFISSSGIRFFKGAGLHPAYISEEQISAEIESAVDIEPDVPDLIFFYGAGCHGDIPAEKFETAFSSFFPDSKLFVFDDLTGAARAHLQKNNGFIAALGTGSTCGRYENEEITRRSAALGYAIGDEGSAADIGKTVIRLFFRNELDDQTHQIVKKKLGNDSYSYWMNRIYGNGHPNRELASVAGNLFRGDLSAQLTTILIDCFEHFIDYQFLSLQPGRNDQIIFTGTVSNAHTEIILPLLKKRDFTNCSVKDSLIEGLLQYHKKDLTGSTPG